MEIRKVDIFYRVMIKIIYAQDLWIDVIQLNPPLLMKDGGERRCVR
jgi:hypothetical protein